MTTCSECGAVYGAEGDDCARRFPEQLDNWCKSALEAWRAARPK